MLGAPPVQQSPQNHGIQHSNSNPVFGQIPQYQHQQPALKPAKSAHNEHVPVNIVAPDHHIYVRPSPKMAGNGLPSDRFGGMPPFQFHNAPSEDDTPMDSNDGYDV